MCEQRPTNEPYTTAGKVAYRVICRDDTILVSQILAYSVRVTDVTSEVCGYTSGICGMSGRTANSQD